MTLREKILKTFIITIREINTHGGPEEFFNKYPVGGMYYGAEDLLVDENGNHIGTQTRLDVLERCKKASTKKLLVCADQVPMHGQDYKCLQRSLGAFNNDEAAYNYGKIIGMQMNDNGIDWVLGPSIDMYFSEYMPLMAISDDPEHIVRSYRQVVRGIQEQGVCATIKHFPGVGTCGINMHLAPGQNVLPFDEWMKSYGYTYTEMFKENPLSVMTTHIALKSYDPDTTDGYYPIATFSKKLTTDLLKGELGFKGAVVTDALIMGGMSTGDLVAETVQAFKAGADLLLWPPVEAAEKIEEAIVNGEIPMSRLDDALARIERMDTFRNSALANNTYDEPNLEFVKRATRDIVDKGMCLLKNDIDLVPLKKPYEKVVIIDATDDGDCGSAQLLQQALIKRGFNVDVVRNIEDAPSQVCWQADIDKVQAGYDLVIFNLNASYIASWSKPQMLIWASHMIDKQKKLIINYGSPFFARDYFPEDPTYIETNCEPSPEAAELLADKIIGKSAFVGKCVLHKN